MTAEALEADPGCVRETHRPRVARWWNLLAGGKDGYQVDLAVVEHMVDVHPAFGLSAVHRLGFRERVTRFLAEFGIDQFLVIGTDLPLQDEVHGVAKRVIPNARVVYATTDPLVLIHARALLAGSNVDHIEGDLHDPRHLLRHAARTLDLDRPVAVLLPNSPDVLTNDQAEAAMLTLFQTVPSGSHVALSYLSDQVNTEKMREIARLHHQEVGEPLHLRDTAQIQRILGPWHLLAPGAVSCSRWHPGEPDDPDGEINVDVWCAVAAKDPPAP